MSYLFVGIASLIHVYIFVMESILWGTPKVNKTFALTPELAEANRLFAFNQGFYNLFLAIAALNGIMFALGGMEIIGLVLMVYSCLSMVGAAATLICSSRELIRPALIQGLPPFLALIFLGLWIKG